MTEEDKGSREERMTTEPTDTDLMDIELGKESDVEIRRQQGTIKGESMPKALYSNYRFTSSVEGAISKLTDEYTDIVPFTEITDIDKILNLKPTNFTKDNQLVLMWGCKRCWMRGTDDCPFSISSKDVHPMGYCDFAMKDHLIRYKLMGTSTGLRHLRNINLANLDDMLSYYLGKLKRLKLDDRISKAEVYLLKNVLKMYNEYLDKIEKAIVQDEGIKVQHEGINADTFNRLFRKAKEKIIEMEKEVGDTVFTEPRNLNVSIELNEEEKRSE